MARRILIFVCAAYFGLYLVWSQAKQPSAVEPAVQKAAVLLEAGKLHEAEVAARPVQHPPNVV